MPHAELLRDLPDNRIAVATEWTEKEMIKSVPGARWDKDGKLWTLPLTWTACLQLRGVFGESLEVGPLLQLWAWNELERVRELEEIRGLLKLPVDWSLAPSRGLYEFQMIGATYLQRARHALLADEMGTGKTVQVLAALEELRMSDEWSAAGRGPAALVICPNSIKTNWIREAGRWLSEDWFVVPIDGSAAARRRQIEVAEAALFGPEAQPTLVVVNYELARTMSRLTGYGDERLRRCRECDPTNGEESLSVSRCQSHRKELNRFHWDAVIVDEAHRIKDPHSQQTRAVWALGQDQGRPMHRWALTGTPIANSPGDLWSIMHWLAPAEFPSRTRYVDRYCLMEWNDFGGLSIVGLRPDTRDEFHAVVTRRMRRVLKSQVLTQLPPRVREMRWVQMGTRQRKAYEELERSLTAEGIDGTPDLIAPTKLAAATRKMQLASATARVTPNPEAPTDVSRWKVTLGEPSTKLDELEAVLDELGGKPVAVCAVSRQLIELAAVRLRARGLRVGLITGAVSTEARAQALDDFEAGRLDVMAFTIQAGGVGLTMVAADTLIFLQRSWSMVDNRQAEDRVYRIGSERHSSVTIIDLVTVDSVEQDQVAAVHDKLRRLDEVTRDRTLHADDAEAQSELDTLEHELMRDVVIL